MTIYVGVPHPRGARIQSLHAHVCLHKETTDSTDMANGTRRVLLPLPGTTSTSASSSSSST